MRQIVLLSLLFFSILSHGQNAFDQRLPNSKKNYSGKSIGNAQAISGKHINTPAIQGDFPMNHILQNQFKGFNLEWNQEATIAILITPQFPIELEINSVGLNQKEYHEGVLKALQGINKLIQINTVNDELLLQSVTTDELGFTHLRYKQLFNGIEVMGGELIAHVKNDALVSISNHLYPTPILTNLNFPTPEGYIKSLIAEIPYEELDQLGKELIGDKRITNTRIVYHHEQKTGAEVWAYRIQYRPNLLDWWEVIVDASNGSVLSKVNKTCSVDGPKTASATDLNNQSRSINTYLVGSTYYLSDASRPMFKASSSNMPNNGVGVIWTLDANFTSGSALLNITSSTNTWTNKTGVSAHNNAAIAYEYFRTTHGRNSINGTGGNVISIINVNNKNGSKMDNAYWNGEMMFYGNGNTSFTPLAGSLDVAGHEMTHGVLQNTANLEYKGQSGAINESMADIFGSLMDRDDWKIGDDITKTSYIPSGALRDLSDPHNGRTGLSQAGYQPKTMSEFYTGTSDNGGVHINSGIVNYAYYLIANSIGKDKAEKIYYRALTVYLTSQSQFVDLRLAVIKSAEDLYGDGSTEAKAGVTAFNTVEIYGYNGKTGGGGSTNEPGEVILKVNTGTEGIVSYNTDASFAGTFYTTTNSGSNFIKKTETTAKRKTSITDDGSMAYFVSDDDDRIIRFPVSGSSLTQTYVSAVGDAFDNVAISKDGKRMAAITTEIDTAIYVYDFTLGQWKKFILYNPTFSGVNSGGVLYADGLDWDYSGQFVVYDAKNFLENSFGSDISWWDIGIIKVWDNNTNSWGDGTVQKLFNQLNENISIGNPSFAKNTGNIIAFDVIDTDDDSYAIYGKNTVTGKTDEIVSNTIIGYPNYSNKDDKLIYDARNTSADPVLAVVNLNADKITGNGNGSVLISDAKWGTWYAQGSRALLSSSKDILSYEFPYLSPKPVVSMSGTTITVTVAKGTNRADMYPTFILSSKAKASILGVVQVSGVSRSNFTNTVTYVVTAEDGSTKNYTVKVLESSAISAISEQGISIYPNPTKHQLHVEGAFQNYSISNGLGRTILEGNESNINTTQLCQGLYTISIRLQSNEVVRIKFVKD